MKRFIGPVLLLLAVFLVGWTELVDNFLGIPLKQATPTDGQMWRYVAATGKYELGTASGGSTVAVQRNDSAVSTADTIDFSTSFVVTESPAGEANVTLDFGTAPNTVAEGNDARFLAAPSTAGNIPVDTGAAYGVIDGSDADTTKVLAATGASSAPAFRVLAAGDIDELLTLAQLSGVTATTGSGTVVPLATSPSIATVTLTGDATVDTIVFAASGAPNTDGELARSGDTLVFQVPTGSVDRVVLLAEVANLADLGDVTGFGGTAQDLGIAASNGSATTVARSDHVHKGPGAQQGGAAAGDDGVKVINVSNGLLGYSNDAGTMNVSPSYGTGANTVCQGNDSRLSDARTPTAHASTHLPGGSDALTVATPIQVAAANAAGSAANFSRGDHAHKGASVQQGGAASGDDGVVIINASNGLLAHVNDAGTMNVSPSYGSSANTITQGNDARLSDKRAPTIASEATNDIMRFDGSNWVRLALGSNSTALTVSAGGTLGYTTVTNAMLAGSITGDKISTVPNVIANVNGGTNLQINATADLLIDSAANDVFIAADDTLHLALATGNGGAIDFRETAGLILSLDNGTVPTTVIPSAGALTINVDTATGVLALASGDTITSDALASTTSNTTLSLSGNGSGGVSVGTEPFAFSNLASGNDANGDIAVRIAGVYRRLGIGSNGQILQVASGLPAWVSAGGSTINVQETDGSPANSGTSSLSFQAGEFLGTSAGNTVVLQLATGGVTNTTLGTDAVTSGKILNGEIVNADINASAGITYGKLAFSNDIVAGDLAANSVDTSEIVGGAPGAAGAELANTTTNLSGDHTMSPAGDELIIPTAKYFKLAGSSADAPNVGGVNYDTDSKSFTFKSDAGVQGLVGLLSATTASSTSIQNTTTPTNFSQNFVLPANSLTVGKVIRITLDLIYSTTGTPTFQLRFLGGSTQIVDSTSGLTLLTGVTNRHMRVEVLMTCRSVGASGTVTAIQILTGSTNSSIFTQGTVPTVTLDTTVSQQLQFEWTWSAASASNSVGIAQFVVEAMN